MPTKLTSRFVSSLRPPASGQRIDFDTDIPGFGVRTTAAGAKSWILDYRIDGRQRRLTIGRVAIGLAISNPDPEHPAPKFWNVVQARLEAAKLRHDIDMGRDPLGERQDTRNAPTIGELADEFMTKHVQRKRRSTTADSYQGLIDQHIKPALGNRKVAALKHDEIDRWHGKISEDTPYRANRALAVLSKMMSFAGRPDNPCRGIERAPEDKRSRYATSEELKALLTALAGAHDRTLAKAVLLLALTGARRGELLDAKWAQFDMVRGVWSKPASSTKQKKAHTVPLSSSALAVIASMEHSGLELFPGGVEANKHRLRGCWEQALADAGITGLRLHDLRHTFASVLASQPGASLPLIGAMLGHGSAATTHRYAHLFDDPQRAAAERVGAFMEAVATGKQAEVVNLKVSK